MAGVLDALASYIQSMLMQMAAEEVHMLLGVSSEIDNMGIKLWDLKNFLADADRRNITDQSVQAWVRELRDAMYDATDILDLCQLKAMEQGPRHDAGCFNPLLFCIQNPLHAHDIGNRIRNLNKKLDGIVGVGGIEKTTLARKIFKNDIVQQELSKKIWLSVNQDFNELDILRRAVTEARGDCHVAGDTKETLERILTKALKGHKTLIIMDDVWDYRAWEDVLRIPLVNVAAANNDSRVLITTRHNTVAHGMMAEEPYHRIRKLEPEDAWLLLKKQVPKN